MPAGMAESSQALAWTMQESGTTASLRGIYSIDGKVAWTSGTEGTVLKTIDSGVHWTKCATPPDGQALDFRGVQAWDGAKAIVMSSGPGTQSRLYRTDDGCKSWTLLFKNPDSPDGFFDSFFADWSEEGGTPLWVGSLLGDPVHGSFRIFDTHDSGATWSARQSPDLALRGVNVAGFAASNSLFPGNQDNDHMPQIFASGGRDGALLWIEKTPEHSWRRISLPLTSGTDSAGIFSIAAHSESLPYRNTVALQVTMIATGGDYQKPGESTGTAAWSTDKGLHWTAAGTPPHGYRSAVAFSAELEAWITAGTNGSDVSRDDGKTWQPLDNGNWNALSLPFAVGPKGRIARLSVSEKK
ncbi:beta propeller repeat protein [Acidicapsa ligni]|uniref:hypothetical protein n=1 Tax=Acidicapsa ligni TaxID=542300 RepID=UPI0021DFD116|nr:hypothetical protein [Acidicapsa ligni]